MNIIHILEPNLPNPGIKRGLPTLQVDSLPTKLSGKPSKAEEGPILQKCHVFTIIICLITLVGLYKVFERLGEKGWKAIIPIWNGYIMYKIAGMKNWFWWSILIAVIGWIIAGFVTAYTNEIVLATSAIVGIIAIVAAFKLPRKFGWGVFTSILYVLFTPICQLVLAFGSSKYEGEKLD